MHARSREVACTLVALGIACAAPAGAADAISTDRPDVVESRAIVGRGHLQFETSIARGHSGDAVAKTTILTSPALLRFSLSDDLEGQLGPDGSTRAGVDDPRLNADGQETGVSDPWSGVKLRVVEGEGLRPAVTVLVNPDIDPGSRYAFKGEGLRPSIRSTLDWRLPHAFSIGAMPGVVYDKTEGRRHASGVLGVALGKAWTARFVTYVETAAERIASSRHGGSTVTYSLGGVYLLRDAVQIDSAFSWGANGDAADLAWTIGLSMKF